MAHNELHLFSTEDPGRPGSLCARCGTTADLHLTLLGEASGRGGTFCFHCCEVLAHTFQQHEAAASPEAATPSPAFPHSPTHHDDAEGGIVFWEGQGWSSDGPFAGA
jgi:hypothetical protein